MKNEMNIMIVGVGGQGTLLASKLIGNVITAGGLDVKVSEVHGMSQRGGSVVTFVKYGKSVASPVIEEGEADIILAFERLEAARWLSYLKRGGKLIVNDQRLDPMPVITGAMSYPDDIIEKIKTLTSDVITIDALSLATKAGSSKAVNVVLMGVLSTLLHFDNDLWIKSIDENVPERFRNINKTAFEYGKKSIEEIL